jgi:uncharacterized membrane protein
MLYRCLQSLPGLTIGEAQPKDCRDNMADNIQAPETLFGDRLADKSSNLFGSWKFIRQMSAVILIWILWNTLGPAGMRFDKYPFIFLTFGLSLQASYAAPLILLAQNRQAARDRVRAETDLATDLETLRLLKSFAVHFDIPIEE